VSSTEGLTATCAAALTYQIGTEDLITLSCIYTKIVHCIAAIIHVYSHYVKKGMGFGFYTLFFKGQTSKLRYSNRAVTEAPLQNNAENNG